MKNVYAAILAALERGEPVVRIAVMESSGSTPRSIGASMAVFKDGSSVGTIGGGIVENRSCIAAHELQPGASAIRTFDLTNTDAASQGMICGGNMTVLLDSMDPVPENIAFIRDVLALYTSSRKGVSTTTLAEDGQVVRREILPINEHTPKPGISSSAEEDDNRRLFVEPLHLPETVHFIGAGHVALAAAKQAAFTGFRVRVMDDRSEFANRERFPDACEILVPESLGHCLQETLGADDYVVIMTRGHLHDRDVLARALETDAGYIGMIGSRKKKAAVYASLLADGFSQADLNRVHCPIGLPIGAETPEEIGISILAELIKVRAAMRAER